MKYLSLLLIIVLLLSACQAPVEPTSDKLQVVATLFPQYDFARIVGGDEVSVQLLLPPGVEAHAYEPTPKEMVAITSADLFLYTGANMEPWAERLISSDDSITSLDLSKGIAAIEAGHEHVDGDEHEAEDEHDHEGVDPHIWTDPNNAAIMVQAIADELAKIKPESAETFQSNAKDYIVKLQELDQELRELFSDENHRQIFFAGHNAFGYFAHRYGLTFHSPYSGFSPDAEPSAQKIVELMDEMKQHNAKAIYYEELIEPKVATVIQESTGAKMLLLNGAHNVSKEDLAAEVGYLDILKKNLESLREGQQ